MPIKIDTPLTNKGTVKPMRCKACNVELNDFESTRKSSVTNEFLDLCNTCYRAVSNDVQAIERYDLMDVEDEVDSYEDQ